MSAGVEVTDSPVTGAAAPVGAAVPAGGAAPADAGAVAAPADRSVRRWRRPLAWAAAVLVSLVLLVAVALLAGSPAEPLDPDSRGPDGAAALVTVLRQRGVDVEVVRSVDDLAAALRDPAATSVAVGNPAYLGPSAVHRLPRLVAGAERLVLLVPEPAILDALEVPLTTGPADWAGTLGARCTAPPVVRAGDTVDVVDLRLVPTGAARGGDGRGGVTTCFPLPDPSAPEPEQPAAGVPHGAGYAVVAPEGDRPETVVLGFPSALTNAEVTSAAHAGLAVRALGASPRLVWYHPGVGDLTWGDDGGSAAGDSVWPRAAGPVVALLGATVVLLALARGRRLGRLVPEPLPVVVRAVETTESRGRLYRRAGDRRRAAAVLRSAATERLRARLGLGRSEPLAVVVVAVAGATGRSPADVWALLAGPAPPDDAALVELARALTDLEEGVRPR